MIVIVPIVWLLVWFLAAGFIGAYSGLAPADAGLELFLAIFLGGGIGLPVVGSLGWLVTRRFRGRD